MAITNNHLVLITFAMSISYSIFTPLLLLAGNVDNNDYVNFMMTNMISFFIFYIGMGIGYCLYLCISDCARDCANYIVKLTPTLHHRLEDSREVVPSTVVNTPLTSDEKSILVLYHGVMMFPSALGSYIMYKTTDSSKFVSGMFGSLLCIYSTFALILMSQILQPYVCNCCVYLATNITCCKRCLLSCADRQPNGAELNEVA